jgi:MioC protein
MAERVLILVGTMTGTAELVAEAVAPVLERAGHAVEVRDMDGLAAADLPAEGLVLVCTSTYGQGDVPDNAMAFHEALAAERPDLAGLAYGVIGLGDSTYADTYNFGGKRFDDLLAGLGARRIGERLQHNASSDDLPEDAGVRWAEQWVEELAARRHAA